MTEPPNDKRQQIIDAAEVLIAEVGFQGLSMQKVACRANVAAGTIYRYFTDKDHLLREVRFNVVKRVAKVVQAGVSRDMPLKQRFRIMWLNIWNIKSSNVAIISNRMQYESLPCPIDSETRALERELFVEINRLFDEGREQGLFKPLDNEVLGGLTFEACLVMAKKHAMGLYQLDEEQLEMAIEASWDAIIKH